MGKQGKLFVASFKTVLPTLRLFADPGKGIQMSSLDEQILRTAKEVVVKFIEVGRISPTGFHEAFKTIYSTVKEAVKGDENDPEKKEKKGG